MHGPVSQEQKTKMQGEDGFKIPLKGLEGLVIGVAGINCPPPEITVLDTV